MLSVVTVELTKGSRSSTRRSRDPGAARSAGASRSCCHQRRSNSLKNGKSGLIPPSSVQKTVKVDRPFDPQAFASKLTFTDEVAALGISEEDATRPQIGFTRGKVYFPIRNEDGSIAGFVGYVDGQIKMPPAWIRTNVVKLKRA
jgi:hypothetical protein